MSIPSTTPHVNVYASPDNHQEAYVIGNETGLIALRNAINEALHYIPAEGRFGAEVFASDGEGYVLLVARVTDEEFDKLRAPYMLPTYAGTGDESIAVSPYSVFGKRAYARVMGAIRNTGGNTGGEPPKAA